MLMICQLCNQGTERRSRVQKYCIPCSELRSEERKKAWSAAHPPSQQNRKKWSTAQKGRSIEAGLANSAVVSKDSIIGSERFIASAGWCVKFKFPYSQAVSKNSLWSFGGKGGHVYRRQAANQYQDTLALYTKAAMAGRKVYINKIWIDLFVQKPTHKSDAINVLDTVCDALKVGLGVDDRWFCIRQLDWEITKNDPHIFISIYQKDTFDAQACSHCGRILAFSNFTKSKYNKSGYGRVCSECRTGKILSEDAIPSDQVDE